MIEEIAMTAEETTLKIIGAGIGRTGTVSIKVALDELGFGPCYHLTDLVFDNPANIDPEVMAQWEAATRGKPVDWHRAYKGYQSAFDWPTVCFYKELMLAFPEARVLLTVRDPEKWFESAKNVSSRVRSGADDRVTNPVRVYIRRAIKAFIMKVVIPKNVRLINQMMDTTLWQGLFEGKMDDHDRAIAIFNQHIEDVKKHVPPEKLLVYNVKDGWGPLCAFLGVEVPDKPFPHVNDRDNFVGDRFVQEQRKRVITRAIGTLVVILLLITLIILFKH